MKITVINGTNRPENESQKVSSVLLDVAQDMSHETQYIDLENFKETFVEYVTLENATGGQKEDIQKMVDADVIMLCVPTYHHTMPGSLKNFLDIVADGGAYNNKVFGVISVNARGDLGAKDAIHAITGTLAFKKSISFVVPIIPIIDSTNIDNTRLEKFITYIQEFIK